MDTLLVTINFSSSLVASAEIKIFGQVDNGAMQPWTFLPNVVRPCCREVALTRALRARRARPQSGCFAAARAACVSTWLGEAAKRQPSEAPATRNKDVRLPGSSISILPGCAAPLYVSQRSRCFNNKAWGPQASSILPGCARLLSTFPYVVLTTKPGDPRQIQFSKTGKKKTFLFFLKKKGEPSLSTPGAKKMPVQTKCLVC